MRSQALRFGLLLSVGGCTGTDAPKNDVRDASADAATAAPAPAVSAFIPPRDQTCPARYALQEGLCVHEALSPPGAQSVAPAVQRLIADYKRGAAAPMVGGRGQAAPAVGWAPDALSRLDPGAFTGPPGDADAAKQKRLAALDAMIARAQARLAERYQRMHDGAVAPSSAAERAVFGAGGSPQSAAGRPPAALDGNPLAARIAQLQNLVQRLPEQDADALRVQLAHDGFTDDEARALLPLAR